MDVQIDTGANNIGLTDRVTANGLPPYPIDITSFFNVSVLSRDDNGVPYQENPKAYHPVTISQYALFQWNEYIATEAEHHRSAFLTQARWFVKHAVELPGDACGWPIIFRHPDVHSDSSWLSALAQGNALYVLVRAYQITQDEIFLEVAHRAACTFKHDILDGGVSAPIGANGIFFEEIAAYPATHKLGGCLFALLGLFEYGALIRDSQIQNLIHRCHATIHLLLSEYNGTLWPRIDLLHRELARRSELSMISHLLKVLAAYTECECCSTAATYWQNYQTRLISRLRFLIVHTCTALHRSLWKRMPKLFLAQLQKTTPFIRVCVPIHAFPVTGGMRAVLAGIAQVTSDLWRIDYVTQKVGPDREDLIIYEFGGKRMSPWQFPMVWLYFLAGLRKLLSLLRQGANYQIILPQDGVFTAAFAGIAGKLTGRRVVCIDHGNLSLLKSRSYHVERLKALSTKNRMRRLIEPFLFLWYWPSLHVLAHISSRTVDHFLVPGIEGDGVEEICKQLNIRASRITRFASMVDVDRYAVLDPITRASMREKIGVATDALVICMICRLAPEKGLDVALDSISLALSALPPMLRSRVCVIIAGDGPLRKQVEAEIRKRAIHCELRGDASTAEVISLLELSDIFLYSSTRGACFSMAILEAMASGCAVVASTLPRANASLLSEGRGIAVPAGDRKQTAEALVRLLKDTELCRQMGSLARNYVAMNHSPNVFKRVMMRATYWTYLDELIDPKGER
jgi:glycosyltransferase involved in cell wall biosynthesis